MTKNVPQIWLTTGLPASGKSTWAMQMVSDSNGGIVRVNLDDIRAMLGFGPMGPLKWNKALESTALLVQDQAILSAIKIGHDVIVDNTHLNKNLPNRYKKLFDGDVVFRVQDFTDVSIEDCIDRDWSRALENKRSVGEKVIRDMARQLRKPWRLTEEYMNDVQLSPRYFPKVDTPVAIVVDIDGTLARHDHRSPYQYELLYTDGLHIHIADMVDMYSAEGYEIIIMSGRPDTYRAETEAWLKNHDIDYNHLFMRDGSDNRNDADVKQDLFDKYVRDDYTVNLWLDDRDRVVRRIRKLGINVVQVAEGDF